MSLTRDVHSKVTAGHLRRDAYLYVRQSTLRQVFENTESTQRQYDLRQQAVRLGWPLERVIVIDTDQGKSGASAADREGFQKLVTEVSLGHAGIVLGLEVSRLARNSTDWHRLLEICALTDTLILDEDGLYDPRHFNDRLLLGMKGTLSETELHVLRARLQGGILNKARRGELRKILPTGLEYDDDGKVILDPDRQIQQTVRTFFRTFERLGSAMATVKYFRKEQPAVPASAATGNAPRVGAPDACVGFGRAPQSPLRRLLCAWPDTHAPDPDGKSKVKCLAQDEWEVVLPGAHPGYITWEQYQSNRHTLRNNSRAHASERRHPPREGPALLQGLAVCGICGRPMTIRYHGRNGSGLRQCQRDGIQNGDAMCQSIRGAGIDQAIGEVLLNLLQPMTLEVSLAVQQELQNRLAESRPPAKAACRARPVTSPTRPGSAS